MKQSLENNIRLYPWFSASSNLLFWFPVFFLYFSSKVTLDQVLMLEAAYYACVVIMEVPSGYLSDRMGRRITLVISSICALLCYLIFTIAEGFALLVVAQGFLAAHISFKSGTDSSLLFESLNQTSRESEMGTQMAKSTAVRTIGNIPGSLARWFLRRLQPWNSLYIVCARSYYDPDLNFRFSRTY